MSQHQKEDRITRSRTPADSPDEPIFETQEAGDSTKVSGRAPAWTTTPERPRPWVGPVHWGSLAEAPPALVHRAKEKLEWIRGFLARGCPRGMLEECARDYARVSGRSMEEVPPYKTLNTWVHRYRQYGFDGLIDAVRSDAGRMRSISKEDQALIETYMLGRGCISPKGALAFLSKIKPGEKLPRYRNIARFMRRYREENPAKIEYAINGEVGYRNRTRLSIATEGVPAGYALAIDSTPADVRIIVESMDDPRDWEVVRPYLTTVMDVGSRAAIAFGLSLEPVTSEILMSVVRRAFVQEANHPGLVSVPVPRMVYVDRGAENRKEFEAAMAELKVEVRRGRDGNPRHNSHVESLIGTISTGFFPQLIGHTGTDIPFSEDAEEPGSTQRTLRDLEYEPLKSEIPVESMLTLDDLETELLAYLIHYNEKGHSSLPADSPELRRLAEEADLLDAEARRVA